MDSVPSSPTPVDVSKEVPPWLCIQFPQELPKSSGNDVIPPHLRRVWPCIAGQQIATVVPADQVPVSTGRPCALPVDKARLSSTVTWNPGFTGVIAQKSGHIVIDRETISVAEKLEIFEDLDASAGIIDFPGPAILHRNILDLVKLSAAGDITVNGSIEAAEIHSGQNIVVHHGICGKNHGKVNATGNVKARFVSGAHIVATDVYIGNEVANSRVICREHFKSDQAVILSGHITAKSGICCDTAGSDAGVRVILEISFPPEQLQRVRTATSDLKKLRQKAKQIQSAIEPLMRNPKFLNAQQKEKATELLFVASDAEDQASQLVASLAEPRRQLDTLISSAIEIRGHLYPGVVVRIAGIESDIRTHFRGPIKVVRFDEAGLPQLIIVDPHGRKVATLSITNTEEGSFLNQFLRES